MISTLGTNPFPEGLLAGLAIVVSAGWILRRAPRMRLDPHAAHGAILAACLGGLVCGHILFTIAHGSAGPGEWLRFWGSQSFFGVLAGGGLAAVVHLRARRLPLLPYADLAAPGVALGYALARVGCFLNGDDFGVLSTGSWGVSYPRGTEVWQAHAARGWIPWDADASLAVVPVQLLLALVGVAVFAALHRARLRRGAAAGIAAASYGVARFLLEPLRDDFAAWLGPLSLSQVFALALASAGVALLAAAYRSQLAASGASRERVSQWV